MWLDALRGLKDCNVFALCGDKYFRPKFERTTDDMENQLNSFDPTYQLPAGERARCMLDWERRQLDLVAPVNRCKVVYINPDSGLGWDRQGKEIEKPDWYR